MHPHWIGVLLIVGSASVASAQSTGSVDEETIRAQLSAYAEARARGDGGAQSAFYTDDADAWFSGTRQMARGKTEIGRDLHIPPGATKPFRLLVERISFLVPEIALVDAQYYSGAAEPNGHVTYVMVKRIGQWKIRAARIARFSPTTR